VKFTIHSTFPSLNEVIRLAKTHWSHYAKLKKELTLSVAIQARAAGLKPTEVPVRVCFNWFESSKRRDVDNVSHGQKYILDGLVEAGILNTDGQRHVLQLQHHFYVDKDNPRVEVEITELIG
jgi:Holliday junction resolvase RusA-like endonuclease